MLGKLFVLLLVCIALKETVVSAEKTCEIQISRQTKDRDEQRFFEHLEHYLIKHRTIQVLSNFLSNGELSLELRFLIDLSHRTVILNPKYVKLSVKNRINYWPDISTRSILANRIETDKKNEGTDKSQIFMKNLENVKKKAFVKTVKNTFNATYYNHSNVNIKYQFDNMLQDNIIFEYLQHVSIQPEVIMSIKEKIIKTGLKKISKILLLSPDNTTCSLVASKGNSKTDKHNLDKTNHHHHKRSTNDAQVGPDTKNLQLDEDISSDSISSISERSFELSNTEDILETPASVVEDDKLETPASVVEDDILETPASVVEDDILETPASVVEDDILETPASVVGDDILETPASTVEDDILETPVSTVEDDILETPASVVEDDILEIPVSILEEDILETPAFIVDNDILEALVSIADNGLGENKYTNYVDSNYNDRIYEDDSIAPKDNILETPDSFVYGGLGENGNIYNNDRNNDTEIYEENITVPNDNMLEFRFFNYNADRMHEKPAYITDTPSTIELNENKIEVDNYYNPINGVLVKVKSSYKKTKQVTYLVKNGNDDHKNKILSTNVQNTAVTGTLGDEEQNKKRNIMSENNNYSGLNNRMFFLVPLGIMKTAALKNMGWEENLNEKSYNVRSNSYLQNAVNAADTGNDFEKDSIQENLNVNNVDYDSGLLNKDDLLPKIASVFARTIQDVMTKNGVDIRHSVPFNFLLPPLASVFGTTSAEEKAENDVDIIDTPVDDNAANDNLRLNPAAVIEDKTVPNGLEENANVLVRGINTNTQNQSDIVQHSTEDNSFAQNIILICEDNCGGTQSSDAVFINPVNVDKTSSVSDDEVGVESDQTYSNTMWNPLLSHLHYTTEPVTSKNRKKDNIILNTDNPFVVLTNGILSQKLINIPNTAATEGRRQENVNSKFDDMHDEEGKNILLWNQESMVRVADFIDNELRDNVNTKQADTSNEESNVLFTKALNNNAAGKPEETKNLIYKGSPHNDFLLFRLTYEFDNPNSGESETSDTINLNSI